MKNLLLAVILALPAVFLGQSKPIKTEALFGSLRARPLGPAITSGRIACLDVVAADPAVMYIGAAGGGIWKSVSAGSEFAPVFDDYTQSIGKIAIDQKHPDTVWVGTGEPWVRNSVSVGDGIYKTTDGGATWEHLGLENTERIGDIIIHPTNPDIVYVAALGHLWNSHEERGVFKTTDGGKTWTKIFYIDDNTGCADLDIDPDNPDILYASMWSFRRYPDFFDSGLNGKSGLFKSLDGGATWTKIQKGLPNEKLGRMAIAVAPSNGNRIYLSVESKTKENKGIYLSDNAGNSWQKVSDNFNATVRPFYFSNMIVDPYNDSIVMKCGLSMIISETAGRAFRGGGMAVHSDVHDIWIDPNNTKHILIGTDGGVYESWDRGYTFKMFMNLPVGQVYRVSVDNDLPYNVYGGLQDNGSWHAPSQKSGGISNADWKLTYGGDGFYSFKDKGDGRFVYAEYQGGNIVRYNTKTGVAKSILAYGDEETKKLRFNWNTPFKSGNKNPNRLYLGAQYLFTSLDRGDTWQRISGDLTTNDPQKQRQSKSGGLSIDNSTAENHCTIYAIEESPLNEKIIWVGTDDGNLQLTKNGGKKWKNVVENIKGLPSHTWVTDVEPGHFDKKTAYVTFDGHRTGDMTTYLFKTTDFGKTWVNLATDEIKGYALSFCEDLVNPDLLFLGTEFGLYISVDGGAHWGRFKNNMPKVAVRDMVIHPRDNALVMATHGRGIVILDDISPLRQINETLLTSDFTFFKVPVNILRDPGSGGGWFGGSGNFIAGNPSTKAKISYFLKKRHIFGKMYVEIYKDGKLLKTIPAGKNTGINTVTMPTRMKKPKAAPTNNPQALFGSVFGPNLEAGVYQVKLVKGKKTYETSFELAYDPKSPYSLEDRAVQRKIVMKLYDLSEKLAYIYHVLDQIDTKVNAIETDNEALKKQIEVITGKVKAKKNSIVALEGDFYVNSGEKIREEVSKLYRQVSNYPGRPSNSQIGKTNRLEKKVGEINTAFEVFLQNDFKAFNDQAKANGIMPIHFDKFETFIGTATGGSSGYNGEMFPEKNWMYKRWTQSPLGASFLR